MKLVVTTSSKLMVLSRDDYIIAFNLPGRADNVGLYMYYPSRHEFDDLLQFFELITDPELKWGITVNQPIEKVFVIEEVRSLMDFKEIDLAKEHPEYFI